MIQLTVKIDGLNDLLKRYEDYRKSMPERMRTCLRRLAEIGVNTADVSFKTAHYDGINDVVVEPFKWYGNNRVVISAVGNSVTFIEFGTGITYADDHPLAQEFGMIRGEFGQGKGKQDTWVYYGEEGTMGEWLKTVNNQYAIRTHGNPANRSMYNAGKEIENKVLEVVREVFKFD